MKIIIAGNYGANNLGDELILEGMLNLLKDLEKAEITVLSGNPKQTTERHKVNAVPMVPAGVRSFFASLRRENKTYKAIKEVDFFILGGGGLFGSLKIRSYFIWLRQLWPAVKYRKKIIMLGQSIGKLDSFIKRLIVKYCFKKAALISVRDESTREKLKKLGIEKKIHLVPDFLFCIDQSASSQKEDQDHTILALRQKKVISKKFIKSFSDFINWLIQNKKQRVTLVDFQQDGEDSDQLLHKKLISKVEDESAIKHLTKISSYKEVEKMFNSAHLVIGMRLHSLLLSIQTKTPFIAISYAPKVENYLKYAKANNFLIKEEDINLKELKFYYEKLENNHARIKKDLSEYNQNAAAQIKRFKERLHTFLDNAL